MSESSTPLTPRERELRRRNWLMIYLPILFGILLALALIITISVVGLREPNLADEPASAWGDAAAILVSLEAMAVLIVPLALFIGLCALFFWLYTKTQPLFIKGQALTGKIRDKANETTGKLVNHAIRPYLFSARIGAIKQHFWRRNV